MMGTIVVVVLLSLALGYVRWEPKWICCAVTYGPMTVTAMASQFFTWSVVNLFATCMSEEVFFRGFLQTQLARALQRFSWGPVGAIAISAALFGFAHFAGGWTYVGLAAVAGVGYGLVFYKTHRLELSIVAHFLLNATHFLLFTYPRLA
jgi:membrane protease YdiL (CAAX protease family)